MDDIALNLEFDEGSGLYTYDTIQGIEGILYGNTTWINGTKDTGLYFDGDGEVFHPSNSLQFEINSYELTGTIDAGVEEHITFENDYSSPVVIAYLSTNNNAESTEVRVYNISSNGATIFLEEPNSGLHLVPEKVTMFVIEGGEFTLPNGMLVKAGIISTTTNNDRQNTPSGDLVSFTTPFNNIPALFSSLNSYNNGEFKTSITFDISTDNFRIGQESAETGTSTAEEVIGWVAFEEGGGNIDGTKFEIQIGNDGLDHGIDDSPFVFNYLQSYSEDPLCIVKQNSRNAKDGSWTRGNYTTESTHSVFALEDTFRDAERNHPAETFAFFAFEDTFSYTTLEYRDVDYVDFGPTLENTLSPYNSEFTILGYINPSNLTSVVSKVGLQNTFLSTGNLLNKFTYFAVRYDSGNVDVFIDDTFYYTANGEELEPWFSSTSLQYGDNLTLGGSIPSVGFFNGKVDEFRFYRDPITNYHIEKLKFGEIKIQNVSIYKYQNQTWNDISPSETIGANLFFECKLELSPQLPVKRVEFFLSDAKPNLAFPNETKWNLIEQFNYEDDTYGFVMDYKDIPDGNWYFI
ncbi:MAG: hypothetical protein P8Y97_23770, partial [Candidatus Lokiarchaeota archaeon]